MIGKYKYKNKNTKSYLLLPTPSLANKSITGIEAQIQKSQLQVLANTDESKKYQKTYTGKYWDKCKRQIKYKLQILANTH